MNFEYTLDEATTNQPGGRQKRILFVLALCFLAGIVVVAFCPHEKEPEYNGHSLSEWLEVCRQHQTPDSDRGLAEEAVRHIGTNALPWLVRWINDDMPGWRNKVLQSKFSRYVPKFVMYRIIKPIIHNRHAEIGFGILGPTAGPAACEVARGLDKRPKQSWIRSLVTLRNLGPEALPPLCTFATNRAKPLEVRRAAMSSMGILSDLGTNEEWVVQAIIPYLSDEEMARWTASALGELRMLPNVSVPALRQAAVSKDADVRLWAIVSLGKFHGDAEQAIPDLNRALVDPDARVRQEASNALDRITPWLVNTNEAKAF